jgi:hypothetical protein
MFPTHWGAIALASSRIAWANIRLRDHRGVLFLQRTRIFWTALAAPATVVLPKPALAEFQIQEAGIEKGETEFEYRAYHWGVPEATENNENANDIVQSHEFELSFQTFLRKSSKT